MVQLVVDRLENSPQLREVHNPTVVIIDRPGYVHLDPERMPVQACAFMASGYIGQAMSRLYLENSEYIHS
jgi:hypothetical protein